MKKIKLGQLIQIKNGTKYKNLFESGQIPIYGSGGIMGFTDSILRKEEALLLPRKGTIGKIYYSNIPFWHVDTVYSAIAINEDVVLKFLYYYLNSISYENLITGSSLPSMTQKDYENIELNLPNLEKQKKIVAILSAIDKKIEVGNKIISVLEKLLREVYEYWFVQFDFSDENNHPYKTSGGEMIYNETLKREIPKGWNIKRVDELCEIKTGKEDANFAAPDGDYKFFTCADEPLRCNMSCFNGKSILIAGNGNFNVKHYDGDFNAYQRTYVLQPDDTFYGITFIEAKNKIRLFTKGSNGSIVKFITKGDVGGIRILVSPKAIELYETFNTILAKIDTVRSENEKLASLRDWLLPMLMNGQVKVTE